MNQQPPPSMESENEWRESQLRTHLALEAANIVAFTWDIKTDVRRRLNGGSAAFPASDGATLAEIAAQIYEADRARFLENLQTAIDHPQQIYRAEYRLMMPDGKLAWFSEIGRFETDESGAAVRLIGISAEITERKIAEEQLRASEARLHLGVEVAEFAICQLDYATDLAHLSKEAALLYGVGDREMSVSRFELDRLFHPDDAARLAKNIAEALIPEGDGWFSSEYRIVRRDGSTRWVTVRKQVFFDQTCAPPRPTIGILVLQDITDRKEAENKIRESEERYRALIKAAAQVEWTSAPDGNFTERQPLWEEFTGQTFEESLDGGWSLVLHPDDRERTLLVWRGAVESKAVYETECRLRRRDGAYRWMSVRAVPILDARGEIREWIGMNADITERKESEQRLRESEERSRLATEAAHVGIWEWNVLTNQIRWDALMFRLYGVEPTGDGLVDYEIWRATVVSEDLAEQERVLNETVERKGRSRRSFRIRRALDGALRYIEAVETVRLNADGVTEWVVGTNIDVTERREAENALREAEERFRLLTENLDNVFWIFNWQEKRGEYVSSAVSRLYGEDYAASLAVEFKNWTDVIHPDDRARAEADFLGIEKTGKYESTYRLVLPDGSIRWRHAKGSPIRDAAGKILKVVGVTEDITDRKVAENQIRESEERLRLATDAAEMFSWENDFARRQVKWSENAAKIIGCAPEELPAALEESMFFVAPDEQKRVFAIYEDASREGKNNYVSEFRGKNGQHWQAHSSIIRNDRGEIVKMVGVTQNVTEQKRAQEKLLEAERRAASDYRKLLSRIAPLAQVLGTARELTAVYRALLDFIRFEIPCEGFFVSFYDAERELKHVKYVWSEGAELDADAMQPIALFKNNGVNSRAIREGKSIITTRELDKMRGQFQVVSQNSVQTVESLVTPMIVMGRVVGTLEVQNHVLKYAPEHIVALEMAANLAAVAIENVRLINIEYEARAAAEEANRAKDEFLAMLSHELRSPLNAMYGWTQILQMTKPGAEQTQKAIEVIARNVRLQKTLIEDLLDVSRIITGKMQLEKESVSLLSIVHAAVDAARPAAEKQGVGFELNLKIERDEIDGDRHRLEQVVGNLLTNAVKFTPDGGLVRISLANAGEKARLTIEDTGIGIAPELLPYIFDRFRQADGGYKRKYGGLGLGLTIVKHLTELHGGTVSAESAGADQGTRFTLEFPLAARFSDAAEDSPAASANEVAAPRTKSLDGARILVVDDDADVLDLVGFVLREEGAAVESALSARGALEFLGANAFDLLISDIGMAEMDGFELIRKLREDEKNLPAIALTGFVSLQDRKRAFDAGFQTHLSKPVDLDRLLSVAVELIKANSG